MKVVHLTYTLDYGGIETMLVHIANEQAGQAEVAVYLINDRVEPTLRAALDGRVRVVEVKRPIGSKNPLYLFRLNRLLRRERAEVIHVHHPGIVRFLCLPCLRKSRLLLTMHDIPLAADLPFLRKYARHFAISGSVRQALAQRGYCSEVVYNGIVPEDFAPRTGGRARASTYLS